MPDYKYVLFDLDGTLIDSWPKLLDTANYFFGGKITVTSEYMQDQYHLGKTLCTFLKEKSPLLENLPNNRISELFWDKYVKNPLSPPLLPGALQFVKDLKHAGIMTGVVTNKRFHVAEKEVAEIPFRHFKCVFGAGVGLPPKPAPDMVLAAMKKIGAVPKKTLFVGDSSQDFHAAKAAGVDCFLISGEDPAKRKKLVELAGKERVVASYTELSFRVLEKTLERV